MYTRWSTFVPVICLTDEKTLPLDSFYEPRNRSVGVLED